jgi:hypothetical protein
MFINISVDIVVCAVNVDAAQAADAATRLTPAPLVWVVD